MLESNKYLTSLAKKAKGKSLTFKDHMDKYPDKDMIDVLKSEGLTPDEEGYDAYETKRILETLEKNEAFKDFVDGFKPISRENHLPDWVMQIEQGKKTINETFDTINYLNDMKIETGSDFISSMKDDLKEYVKDNKGYDILAERCDKIEDCFSSSRLPQNRKDFSNVISVRYSRGDDDEDISVDIEKAVIKESIYATGDLEKETGISHLGMDYEAIGKRLYESIKDSIDIDDNQPIRIDIDYTEGKARLSASYRENERKEAIAVDYGLGTKKTNSIIGNDNLETLDYCERLLSAREHTQFGIGHDNHIFRTIEELNLVMIKTKNQSYILG